MRMIAKNIKTNPLDRMKNTKTRKKSEVKNGAQRIG